ncbi:MAG: hypothetical protein US20_C0026G0021 [Candidatus Pacebacteria bacterium GW2011_GWF1_36_5]|nr:MAG: hypothetical protein US20_C0026G0021 [Candidatus Pacebacteria bacterium GW2011_GWF1_36_5]
MTNRQFKKILAMHREGISSEICIAAIIELCPLIPSVIVAQWILRFIDESYNPIIKVGTTEVK